LLSTGFVFALWMSCLGASSVPVGVREESRCCHFSVGLFRTKTRTQSSEHGVVATGKLGYLLGGVFIERHIRLLRAPEAVKQHGQLAGYCNNGLTLGLLATSCG
jgi:hypothetical protein